MLSTKIALVDTTGRIDPKTMIAVAAALNLQVTRDLPQFWPVKATVSYLPDPKNIPQGFWPVQLVASLPPGEGGFHQTRHRQPYAKVIASPDSDEWTIDASHEVVEMLVDPAGSRLQTSLAIAIQGDEIVDAAGKFEYLVEACDPCEADSLGYTIEGISVSDFITPHFYDLQATPGTRYSFTGAISRPREILRGGYISFVNPLTQEMQQILWVNPGPPQLRDLGPAADMSLREFVETKTHYMAREARSRRPDSMLSALGTYRSRLDEAGRARAELYK
jgi:hypothetical protein